jgi:hypothetical protein
MEKPYFLIDFFPACVPAARAEAFVAAEEWLLTEDVPDFSRRVTRILLKLSCYFECEFVHDGKAVMPSGAVLLETVSTVVVRRHCTLEIGIAAEDTLITLDAGDLYLTVYHPSARAVRLLQQLAASEGLFWRQGNA